MSDISLQLKGAADAVRYGIEVTNMALDKDIKAFCRNSGTFSIPLIQLEFSVTYKEAARAVDELVGAGEASPLADELNYEYIVKERVAPSNGRKSNSMSADSESGDIVSGHRNFLKRHIDERTDTTKCEEDDEDEDDDADEEERNRRRREYLERRRRELIARMREEMAENDEDDDDDRILINDDDDDDDDEEEDDDDNPFEDDKFSMTAHSLFAKSEEEEMLEKIRNLLIGGDRNSKLAVAALKLCASEGYVSPWLLCKTQHADDSTAEFICFWLYVNDFIKRDDSDENKYLLAIPESLFFACCNEAEEHRNSLGHLAGTLKKIGEQKQEKEQEECASLQKYVNNYQFRKVVRSKLIALVRTDLKMTRAKAITKAEGCLCAARDMGNDKAAAVYEKVIFELNNMSDYMFNRLKSQHAD